jgi:microcystin-dependent protein
MATELQTIKIIELTPVSDLLPGLLTVFSDASGDTRKATAQQLKDWVSDSPLLLNAAGTTPPNGDASTKLATTQYVQSALSGLGLGVASPGNNGTVRLNTNDPAPIVYVKSEIDAFNSAIKAIANGGTGANTVSTARAALGAAISGENTDITQLTALTSIPTLIQAAIDAAIPVGAVISRASGNTPDGRWLPMDGRAVSRTIYAALFAEIGTVYGNGNGSTTFNLPKAPGRSIIGEGVSDFNTTLTVGQKIGNETATLAIANLPSHNHGGGTSGTGSVLDHFHGATSGNAGTHGHSTDTFLATNTATSGGGTPRVITGGTVGVIAINPAGDHTHNISVGSIDRNLDHTHQVSFQGSNAAFNIVPPSLVLKYFIKY